MSARPEQQACQTIDAMLAAAGWAVQDYKAFDPSASLGMALREVPLKSGRCDYLLLVNLKAVGVVEAKKEGITRSIVADQSAHYAANLPDFLAAALDGAKLPDCYESTGVKTFFRDERDPHPRPRRVFSFHWPEALAQWMDASKTLRTLLAEMAFAHPLKTLGRRDCQVEGINDLATVAPNAGRKICFVPVDAGGVTESNKTNSLSLDSKPIVAFDKLL